MPTKKSGLLTTRLIAGGGVWPYFAKLCDESPLDLSNITVEYDLIRRDMLFNSVMSA